jgi:hypothetical protein
LPLPSWCRISDSGGKGEVHHQKLLGGAITIQKGWFTMVYYGLLVGGAITILNNMKVNGKD